MKLSTVIIGVLVLMAVCMGDISAKRNRGNRNKGKNSGCSEWTYGECVPKQGTCGKGRKQGTREGANCQLKEKQFRCMVACPEGEGQDEPRCSLKLYDKSERGECDISTNLQNVTFTLKDGSNADCPPTLVKSMECRRDENGKKIKKGCKFTKGQWGECDPVTGLMTRVDTLKKSRKRARAAGSCEESRILTKPCIFGERRQKTKRHNRCSEWTYSECIPDQGTCGKGKKMGTRTGDQCQLKEKDFRCRIPCRPSEKGNRCRPKLYTKGMWSECNATTHLKTVTFTLKDGSNTNCPATKVKSKKCRTVAEDTCPVRFYDKSPWSDCDSSTFMKTVTLTLKAGSNAACPQTKVKSKKCKLLDENGKKIKPACKFSKGQWSECNEATGMSTRVDSLQKAKNGHSCAETRTMSKPCKKRPQSEQSVII